MEGKQRRLAAKQACIDRAFAQAKEKLLSLPEAEYVELLAKLDGTSVDEQREKLEKAMDEVEEGKDDPALISEDGRLNNRKDVSFGSSAYVCARVTTGTQNYCPFAGSGR